MRRFPVRTFVLFSSIALASTAGAADPSGGSSTTKSGKADGKATKKVDVNLGLGGLGLAVPKAEGLEAKKAASEGISPKVTTTDVSYSVEKVEHAYDFTRTATGPKPVGDLLQHIELYGKPPSTPKFTTLVRVKATQNVNTSIEVVVLDPRGDTAMSGAGELSFSGSKTGETDWLIDWAPTARPKGGEYKVLVRVAGQPMGTWPLKVVEEKK